LTEDFCSAAGNDDSTDKAIIEHLGRTDINDDIGGIAQADPALYDAPPSIATVKLDPASGTTIAADDANNEDDPNNTQDPFLFRSGEDDKTYQSRVWELKMYV
jgi:hypothetical protein